MRSEALNEFMTLAEMHSFTKAAKRLFISQSTLSSHVKSMEKELGFQLVDHTKSGFALTEAGKAFLDKSNRLLEEFDLMVEECRTLSQNNVGKVRMSFLHMPPNTDLFNEVTTRFADEVVPLELEYHTTVVEGIKDGVADIGLAIDCGGYLPQGDISDNDPYAFEWLGGLDMQVAVFKDDPVFENAASLTSQLLEGATVLSHNASYYKVWRNVMNRLFGSGLNMNLKLVDLSSLTEYISCQEKGGVIMLPKVDMNWYFKYRSDLRVFSELDGHPMQIPYGMFYRKGMHGETFEELLAIMRSHAPTIL